MEEPVIGEDGPGTAETAPEGAPRRGRPANSVVELDGVSKAFGDVVVLDSMDLGIEQGQLFGLIGPSGCGKTTLVRLLVGLSAPTDGVVRVYGHEPKNFGPKERELIGYMPQGFNLYPTMTVLENARFTAGLYGLGWRERRRRIKEVLTFLEIWDARKRRGSAISGGMQRRLSLACALLHRPRVLFVDEPTAGLDPVLRTKIWEHLQDLRDRGTTIILTTQYIDEAVGCDRVAILDRGRIVADGAPDDLRREAASGEALDVEAEQFERGDIAALWQLPSVQRVQWVGQDALRCYVDDVGTATVAITEALHERGTEVRAIRPYLPSFDEVFLKLVGRD